MQLNSSLILVSFACSFDAEINDLFIDDLNNFDILNVDLQLFKFQLEFSFFFSSIKTTGQYKAKGKALNFIPFNRGGKFGFNFNGELNMFPNNFAFSY